MKPHETYTRVNIATADPVRIVVMLYEGAIKNLNQANRLFGAQDQEASAKVGRTLEIIHYLSNALDHTHGGQIATNLERLYEYMRDTLNEANIQRDKAKIEETITLMQTLLEGWRTIAGAQTPDPESPVKPQQIAPLHPPQSGLSMVG